MTSFRHIAPPELVRRPQSADPFQERIASWIRPWSDAVRPDAGLLMVPFTRASQRGDSGGAQTPNALRQAFVGYSTYSPDFDVDLKPLQVCDLGDVRLHMTDVAACHASIEDALVEVAAVLPGTLPIIVGGDHSITAPLVRGYARAHPARRIGIVHFDAHYDVRSIEEQGPHDGTPFRAILEGEPRVDGRNLVQLGVHGFMSSSHYRAWCLERGVTQVSARTIRSRGILRVMREAIAIAGDGTDAIYVSLDIDCLAHNEAPGAGGTSAEGMAIWDLLEAMFLLGQEPKVAAIDIVSIDPLLDVRSTTVKAAVSIVLTFLAGQVLLRTGGRGY